MVGVVLSPAYTIAFDIVYDPSAKWYEGTSVVRMHAPGLPRAGLSEPYGARVLSTARLEENR